MGLEWLAVLMFLGIFLALALGYPVGPTFAGVAIIFAVIGLSLDVFNFSLFRLLQNRWFGTMSNFSYLAIPYFVYMGTVLEKSGLAEELLTTVGRLFGRVRGGLAVGVVLVGALLGATTGVVAASVITMGVISLPVMLRNGYDKRFSTGVIAASGTLAQIIPPATVLIILADQLGVPLGNLFVGAIIPGLLLVVAFIVYCLIASALRPTLAPAVEDPTGLRGGRLILQVVRSLVPTLGLIFVVLGSIYYGVATPSEAGAVGAFGALILAALYRKFNFKLLKDAALDTVRITSLVVLILFGSTMFSLVFDGLGGTRLMVDLLSNLPGGYWGFIVVSMIAVFLLGIFLEFIEICFITLPIFVPAAQILGIDLTWFGILMALNLYTAFISPPVGFTLFFLSSVAPNVKIGDIFRGVIPFMVVALVVLAIVIAFPQTVTYLTTRSSAGFMSP